VWTLSGQHTGLTDLPLTQRGERNARRLEERLRGVTFAKVWTSPLQRATRTCELAGFRAVAEIDRDLLEWNYGEYEGRSVPLTSTLKLTGLRPPHRGADSVTPDENGSNHEPDDE
jgi:broad specificity phosphatase PhoE